jgi:hypothetical protein
MGATSLGLMPYFRLTFIPDLPLVSTFGELKVKHLGRCGILVLDNQAGDYPLIFTFNFCNRLKAFSNSLCPKNVDSHYYFLPLLSSQKNRNHLKKKKLRAFLISLKLLARQ